MNGVEYDPNYAASYRAWMEGGAADESGEEEGDYAEEEEQRINATISAWKGGGDGNIKKRGRPKGSTSARIRTMQSQEKDGLSSPPAINLEKRVYKATDSGQDISGKPIPNGLVKDNGNTRPQNVKEDNQNDDNALKPSNINRTTPSIYLSIIKPFSTVLYGTVQEADVGLSSPAVQDALNGIGALLEFYKGISDILINRKPIEATILLLAYKNHIIYLSHIHNIFPSTSKSSIKWKLDSMVKNGFIQIVDKNNGYKEEAKMYENAILNNSHRAINILDKVVYYALTEQLKLIMPQLKKELESAVPEDTMKLIKGRTMKEFLYHTEGEHKTKEFLDLQHTNKEINAYLDNTNMRLKFGKDISSILTQRVREELGDEPLKNMTSLQYQQYRLKILQEMYGEAIKRK